MMPSACGVTSSRIISLLARRRAPTPWIAGAERDDLVGVHALARLALEELAHRLLDLGHARHAADEDDVLDLVLLEARVRERLLADLDACAR